MAGEKAPYILLPHSMSGIEAIRWKQLYPDDIKAIVGLDMATPLTYMEWGDKEINSRLALMRKFKRLNDLGLLFWYPVSKRSLSKDEIQQHNLLKRRNLMNHCYINEAKQVLKNAGIVDGAGKADCPTLMFVSDGKETGIEKWSEIQKEYASELSNATVVELYCGHYVHNYKQEQISEEMKEFIGNIK